MSLATSNRDGGRTNEAGHLRGVSKGLLGQVLNGLNVSQRAAGANMSVDVAIGDALINRSDGTYGHPVWNDAVYNQTIATSDGSNPRRDIIVMYIDYGQTPSTGVSNNTNGVVKITSVAGTAAGSPVDPSSATIQSAIGSGNPYIKLARVRVAAGAMSISDSVIDDLRLLAHGLEHGGWIYDTTNTWVYASSTSFTIAGTDATAQFPVGTKIALYQGGSIKYFAVASTSFSTNTTVNLDGGSSYSLTNVVIDRPAYSYEYVPTGYPFTSISTQLGGYQFVKRTTLASDGNTLDVQSLSTFKYLRVLIALQATGGTVDSNLTFNGDTAANYTSHYVVAWTGTVTNGVSLSSIPLESGTVPSGGSSLTIFDIVNVANKEKLMNSENMQGATGAATGLTVISHKSKWVNTSSAINRITVTNAGTGNILAGSEIVVLGKN